MKRVVLSVSLCLCASWTLAVGIDWPGWRGPHRDEEITRPKPAQAVAHVKGPKLLWKTDKVGPGYASVAVVGDTIYSAGDVKENLVLMALDLDGRIKWPWVDWGGAGPAGSRSTPTVDGDRVYVLSPSGTLGCFDTAKGQKQWSHSAQEFGGITGPMEVCRVGAHLREPGSSSSPAARIASCLRQATGETVWKSTVFKPARIRLLHSVEFDGRDDRRRHQGGLWRSIPSRASSSGRTACRPATRPTAPPPRYADGYVFWANGYGKGGCA